MTTINNEAVRIKNNYNLRHKPSMFKSRKNAFNSLNHYIKKCYTVVLGENDYFLVVCFSDAQKLIKNGLEIAL